MGSGEGVREDLRNGTGGGDLILSSPGMDVMLSGGNDIRCDCLSLLLSLEEACASSASRLPLRTLMRLCCQRGTTGGRLASLLWESSHSGIIGGGERLRFGEPTAKPSL